MKKYSSAMNTNYNTLYNNCKKVYSNIACFINFACKYYSFNDIFSI